MLESLECGISISYQLKLSGFVLCLALLWVPIYTLFGFFVNEVTSCKKGSDNVMALKSRLKLNCRNKKFALRMLI